MANELLLARIDERLAALKLSDRKASLKAELHHDTIRRIRMRGQSPGAVKLAALAKALGVSADYLIGATAEDKQSPSQSPEINLSRVVVRGDVQAGLWREATEWEAERWFSIMVPDDPRYPDMQRFALQVRGDSMDKKFPDHTILVCVLFYDLSRIPKPGEYVICCRRSSTGEYEATVKQYEIDAQGRHILWPRSNNPDHQQPIVLSSGGDLPIGTFGSKPPRIAHASDFGTSAGADDLVIVALVTQAVTTV